MTRMTHALTERAPIRTALLVLLFPLALVGIWNATPTAAAQEIGISGFIKTSYYYDTNQIPAVREGDFVLYPIFVDDGTGENDESAEQDNLLFVPFFSRLTFSVGDLPEALGAKTTGYLEGDFYGPGNATNNTYRIRRAFVKLDWATHEVLFGMDWTPLFLSSWARTVATEAGAPFNPFARHVMAKLVLKPESFRLTGILSQQRDAFAEIGGLKQQQQSGLPGAMLGLEYVGEGGTNVGLNAYYKWIRPGLTTDRFGSGAVQAYANLITEGLEARGNVTFGGDLADHLMTGGYAVLTDGTNVEFVPLNTVAAWLDLQTRGDLSVGIFGGYSQSLGTAEDDARGRLVEFVARGYGDTPIQNVWRVSPRVTYTSGKVRIGAEVQATGAAYVVGGDIYDESLAPDGDTENVVNIRGNLSVFLFF